MISFPARLRFALLFSCCCLSTAIFAQEDDCNGNGFPDADEPSRPARFHLEFYEAGDGPDAIISVDLNGDDHLDLATTNTTSNIISVHLGLGDGSFASQRLFARGAGDGSIVSSDFNRDGIPDLAASNCYHDDVSVLLGRGDGSFEPQRRFYGGDPPWALVTGDFDGDGVNDLVTASGDPLRASLSHLRGRGVGTFESERLIRLDLFDAPLSIIAVDLDDDWRRDLVAASPTQVVSVRRDRGDGSFAAPAN